jgi:hypothetical protein
MGRHFRFHAIAFDASGVGIPVMQSDEAFALLSGQPDEEQLRRLATLMRAFTASLVTDAGMLVANPAFCPSALQPKFSRNACHGTAVGSRQQARFSAGLARQLARRDLGYAVHAQVLAAQRTLWARSLHLIDE